LSEKYHPELWSTVPPSSNKMARGAKRITTSFRLTPTAFKAFKDKVPSHGDRSRLLAKFVDLFTSGKFRISEELVLDTTTGQLERIVENEPIRQL